MRPHDLVEMENAQRRIDRLVKAIEEILVDSRNIDQAAATDEIRYFMVRYRDPGDWHGTFTAMIRIIGDPVPREAIFLLPTKRQYDAGADHHEFLRSNDPGIVSKIAEKIEFLVDRDRLVRQGNDRIRAALYAEEQLRST